MIGKRQAQRLRALGAGHTVITPNRREWAPLLDRGLVERDPNFTKPPIRDSFEQPLRITPAGYRELATYLAHHGWPEPKKPKTEEAIDA